mmetsp:Transcript_24453/g.77251  ORF Transcript_24453/g.77251 Transcript_24453/m.77251 type:complete len:342 (+) Transcript_24453:1962-2987(+)
MAIRWKEARASGERRLSRSLAALHGSALARGPVGLSRLPAPAPIGTIELAAPSCIFLMTPDIRRNCSLGALARGVMVPAPAAPSAPPAVFLELDTRGDSTPFCARGVKGAWGLMATATCDPRACWKRGEKNASPPPSPPSPPPVISRKRLSRKLQAVRSAFSRLEALLTTAPRRVVAASWPRGLCAIDKLLSAGDVSVARPMAEHAAGLRALCDTSRSASTRLRRRASAMASPLSSLSPSPQCPTLRILRVVFTPSPPAICVAARPSPSWFHERLSFLSCVLLPRESPRMTPPLSWIEQLARESSSSIEVSSRSLSDITAARYPAPRSPSLLPSSTSVRRG